jgi:ribosomal protein S18 acetylase RimI-like enzyme
MRNTYSGGVVEASSVERPAEAVRPATTNDLVALLALDPLAQTDAGRRSLLSNSVDAGECLVCEDEGQVAGFIVVKPCHFFGRDFIELLWVAPRVRRTGVGRSLMEAATTRREGSAVVFTSTNRSNEAMRALLEAGGWRFSGQLDGLDEGDPELVYYLRRT